MSEKKQMNDFHYDGFPCSIPLPAGYETAVANTLYETNKFVQIEELTPLCGGNAQSVRNTITRLRQKLLPGWGIKCVDSSYCLVYGVEESDSASELAEAKRLFKERRDSIEAKIIDINSQLQALNRRKEHLKRKLEIFEVGILAAEECESEGLTDD